MCGKRTKEIGQGVPIVAQQDKKLNRGVPVVEQWLTNPTRNYEGAGSVPALPQRVKDPVLPRAVV